MTTRIAYVFLLVVVVVSVGLAQNAGSEKPTLLQDKGLQLGVQIGGLIGDNENPAEMKIIRMDNLAVQLFETFSPRVFLDFGLMNYVRGQFGAGFGKIVGRYYSTSLIPIDYRFMVIPTYARCFSPYLYLGIGGLHYDVSRSHMSAGVATTGWAAFMPGGVGFVSQVSDRLALDFNVGYNVAFSDDVNGLRNGNNDSYISGHFGIRFPLAGKTAAERQQEELQKRLAYEEQQRKDAELKAAEEQQRKELEAKKVAEEQRLKEQEAQKALEAQKAQEVKKPAEPVVPPPEQPKEVKKEIMFETVYFKTNSSKLAPKERVKLNAAAKVLQENPDVNVQASGHTDITGSRSLNERLSHARANVVKHYLVRKGVSGKRLTTKGYAFDKPAAPNTTVEGRSLNRRTELDVVK